MDPVIRFQCRDSKLEVYVIQPGERLTIYGSCSVLCLGQFEFFYSILSSEF